MTATAQRRRRGKRRRSKGNGGTPPAAPAVVVQPPAGASTDPRVFNRRYEIGRILGEGSFKSVFEAHDTVTSRDVALGVYMEPASSARFIERYLAVRAAGPHRSIVEVHDAGIGMAPNGTAWPYVVMELLPPGMLTVRSAVSNNNNNPLPTPVVVHLARTLLDGLRHLHRAGLVHGSAHAQNVLMDVGGSAMLTDFDWVAPAGQTRIKVDELIAISGAHQVTPEQLRGLPHDERADLYVAALTIYLATCGHYPYQERAYPGGFGFDHNFIARLDRLPETPTTINPRLPKELSDLLLRMLASDPGCRPQSAEEAFNELFTFIS